MPCLAVAPLIEVGTRNGASCFLKDTGHGAVSASALPNIAIEFFVVDQSKCRPWRCWEKVWSIEIGEPLHRRLEAAVQIVGRIRHDSASTKRLAESNS